MLISSIVAKTMDKQRKHPEKYDKIVIEKDHAIVYADCLGRMEILNACIIYEKGARQVEWQIVDGELEKKPYELLVLIKRFAKAWVVIVDGEESQMEFGEKKENTEFFYPGDDSALLVGVIEFERGVFAFYFENNRHLEYFIEADKGNYRTSDLYGLMMGMRQRRIETSEEARHI